VLAHRVNGPVIVDEVDFVSLVQQFFFPGEQIIGDLDLFLSPKGSHCGVSLSRRSWLLPRRTEDRSVKPMG
jgi:hypothetical protein